MNVDAHALRKAVKAYKYESPSLTLTERLFLRAFWMRFTECLPRTLAPNTMTVIGFAFAVLFRVVPDQ